MLPTTTRIIAALALLTASAGCQRDPGNVSTRSAGSDEGETHAAFLHPPLIANIYTADPAAHVLRDTLFIYTSHDIDTGVPPDDVGSHFDMNDYRVFSLERLTGEVTDHGVALALEDIPWAARQLWAPDAAHKDGTYYLYFPAKDRDGVFRIGVARASEPAGPFRAEPRPIAGSYSVDPAVFEDDDGKHYLYWGGIRGGQLQRWRTGTYREEDVYPSDEEAALTVKVALLSDDLLSLAETPRDVVVLDEAGKPLTAGDTARRFFEGAWVHRYGGKYYLSYATGDTHFIVYATGESPYGPFTYRGRILEPVLGWTSQHSIVEYQGDWYLFYHDAQLSNGKTHLRNVKVAELHYTEDGAIRTLDPYVEPQ